MSEEWNIDWENEFAKEDKVRLINEIRHLKFFSSLYLKYTFARDGITSEIREVLEEIILSIERSINEISIRQDKPDKGSIKWS
jgi:hypothetical protein